MKILINFFLHLIFCLQSILFFWIGLIVQNVVVSGIAVSVLIINLAILFVKVYENQRKTDEILKLLQKVVEEINKENNK